MPDSQELAALGVLVAYVAQLLDEHEERRSAPAPAAGPLGRGEARATHR